MSNLAQIRNWQAQLQQARLRLAAEQARLQKVPVLKEESLITDPRTVAVTVANNISEPGLRARCILLAQVVVAKEEYQRAEVVGPPTDRTTGSSRRSHRPDDPHITVRLPDQTIHIYVRHRGGKAFVCNRNARLHDSHYQASGYNYEDLGFGPKGYRFSNANTPRERRIEQTQRNIQEINQQNAPIMNRIRALEERIRALQEAIQAAQDPHGNDRGGRGGGSPGRDGHDRSGSYTKSRQIMSTSMAHHTGRGYGGGYGGGHHGGY